MFNIKSTEKKNIHQEIIVDNNDIINAYKFISGNTKYDKISDDDFEKLLENEDLLFNKFPSLKKFFFSNLNNIIIYTPEKVGSTSLWASLNLSLPEFNILHIHGEDNFIRMGLKELSINHIIKIYQKLSNFNLLLIDIYRPIYDIIISNYFNDLTIHFQTNQINLENKDIIIKRFNDLFIFNYNKYSLDYYKTKYGIEIENNVKFDCDNKHLFKKMNNISFLKLRLLDCNIWPKILQKYTLKNRNIPILHTNSTNNKSIKELYNYFKTNYKIPNNYYELLKNDFNFNFYFDKNEQENYLSQFKEKTYKDYIPYNLIQIITYFTLIMENETFSFSKYINIIKSNYCIINDCNCPKCVKQKKILYDYCYNKKLTKDDYNEIKDILSKISNIYT